MRKMILILSVLSIGLVVAAGCGSTDDGPEPTKDQVSGGNSVDAGQLNSTTSGVGAGPGNPTGDLSQTTGR